MKQTRRFFLAAFVAVLTIAGVTSLRADASPVDVRAASTMTTTCTNVSTSTTILAANNARLYFMISTTSGAATIYYKAGTGAAVPVPGNVSSHPLQGGSAVWQGENGEVYMGAISAVAKTGTVYVCVDEVAK